MLTQMQFKNWRSLRDVTIDNLTPITVFIGANSSGKSNILDALHFLRYAQNAGVAEAAFVWRTKEKARSIGVKIGSQVEIRLDLTIPELPTILHETILSFPEDREIAVSQKVQPVQPSFEPEKVGEAYVKTSEFVALRWQLLREGFFPPPSLAADTVPGSDGLYIIEPTAQNVPLMLNFMRQNHPAVYKSLEADLQLLLDYVSQLGAIRDDKEIRYFVEENSSLGEEAPTLAGGTARIIAMLTAYYAFDMRSPELPGLVAIEEPDTAIHPLLLGNLVDLLRSYTERESPRQFILTTHNPQVLNFFEPHEVRIVERDKNGITTVKPVDEKVAAVWREQEGAYNLGNLWTTRLIGGVP